MYKITIPPRYIALGNGYEKLTLARVILQEKNKYKITYDSIEQPAKISGKYIYEAKSPSDYPSVGDYVMVDTNGGETAIIHYLLPRKSVFMRKAAGRGEKEQIVASNIDTLFICMSLNNDFNLRRLERYLGIAWDSGSKPVIVLTKSDLCDDIEEKKTLVESVALAVDVIVVSSINGDGYEKILPYLNAGETIALVGSSGVGKSTLINRLLGEDLLSTNELRNDDKGRHTTTRRELLVLPNGAMVIDTPGMRELGAWNSSKGINTTFEDVELLVTKCKFRNCTHTNEPNCAIKNAILLGELDVGRFESYKKLKEEAVSRDEMLRRKNEWSKGLSKFTKQSKKEIW